jgi:hypothetical protein
MSHGEHACQRIIVPLKCISTNLHEEFIAPTWLVTAMCQTTCATRLPIACQWLGTSSLTCGGPMLHWGLGACTQASQAAFQQPTTGAVPQPPAPPPFPAATRAPPGGPSVSPEGMPNATRGDPPSSEKSSAPSAAIAGGAVVGCLVIVGAVGVAIVFMRRRRLQSSGKARNPPTGISLSTCHMCHVHVTFAPCDFVCVRP